MARSNRCYLCGGALRKGRCVECGLDNDRMTKRTYRLNETTPVHIKRKQIEAQRSEQIDYANEYKKKQYSLENMGSDQDQRRNQRRNVEQQRRTTGQNRQSSGQPQTTRVKQDLKNAWTQKTKERQQQVQQAGKAIKGSKIGKIIVIFYVIIMILSVAGGLIGDLFERLPSGSYEFTIAPEPEPVIEDAEEIPSPYIDDESYSYALYELSEDGDIFDENLMQGNYQVGVHIPEGTYDINLIGGDYGSIWLKDAENVIYLSFSIGEDADYQYLENVRMYEGAYLQITGNVELQFIADNAQEWLAAEVPEDAGMDTSSSTYRIDAGDAITAGETIPAGIYNLEVIDGWATLTTTYQDENGNIISNSFWLSDSDYESVYKNVPILADMEVSVEYGDVQLIPSIWGTADDAEAFFEKINY